jgi:hypothetical protein
MKTLAFACLAAAALTTVAHATPAGCLALTDPAGDQVQMVYGGAPAASVPVLDALDLLAVTGSATPDALTATFTLAAPVAPAGQYTYSLEFSDGEHDYQLQANVAGVALTHAHDFQLLVRRSGTGVGGDGGGAEQGSWARVDVTGAVTGSTVTVTAPAAAFGATSLAGGSWTVSEATTNAGALGTTYGSFDVAEANGAVIAAQPAGTCAA